jgi:putative transposase
MKFIAIKTKDGVMKGKISFYCRMLNVSRQGFYDHLESKDRPWKYQPLVDAMIEISSEDEYLQSNSMILILLYIYEHDNSF